MTFISNIAAIRKRARMHIEARGRPVAKVAK